MQKCNFKEYEPDIDKIMKEVQPTKCIIDVGCADGGKRFIFREYFNGPIYFFEPNPRWENKLRRIEKEPNCFVERKAVCNIDGEVELLQSKNHSYSSTIKYISPSNKEIYRKKYGVQFENEPIVVPCTTLNNWIKDKNIEEIDMLWLDAEGAELDILEEGSEIIKITKYIFLEYFLLPFLENNIYKVITEKILTEFKIIYMDRANILYKRSK